MGGANLRIKQSFTRRKVLSAIGSLPIVSGVAASGNIALTDEVESCHLRGYELPDRSIPEEFELSVPMQDINNAHILSGTGDPMINGVGWDQARTEDLTEILHMLHIDSHTSGFGARVPPSFSGVMGNGQYRAFLREGVPLEHYAPHNIEKDREQPWIKALHEDGWWEDIDDTAFVEDVTELFSERFDGSLVENNPSISADPTLDIMSLRASEILNFGPTNIYLDGKAATRMERLDFSPWAQRAFRNYLHGLTEERLNELDIDNPDNFDIREYIHENDLLADGPEDDVPWTDEVLREYSYYQYEEIQEFWKQHIDRLHEAVSPDDPNRINSYGNKIIGHYFDHTPVASYLVSDSDDIIFIEDGLSFPPEWIRDVIYKVGRSMGRYNKRCFADGGGPPVELAEEIGVDRSIYRPTLARIRFGEGYANGGLPVVDFTGHRADPDEAITNWLREDLSWDDSLQSIVDFVWAHEPYLNETTPNHSVALVYSLPTLAWNQPPSDVSEFVIGRRDIHTRSFTGAAEKLTNQQIPYDVITFGHTRLWSDEEQLQRLSEYEVVVLPDIESINDNQVEALQECVETGTGIVVSGRLPDRTEDFEQRADVENLLTSEESIRILSEDPAREDSVHATDTFTQAIESLHDRQVEAPVEHVGVNIQSQPGSDRLICHLVNYDYNHETDTINAKSDLELMIRDVNIDVSAVRWYDDERPITIDFTQTEEGVSFTLPNLDEWGFAVIAESEKSLIEGGDKTEAKTRVEKAEETVAGALEEGRTQQISETKATAHRARVLFEYERYDLAYQEAEDVHSSIQRAHQPPVIGIDQAHNQPAEPEGNWDEFEGFREAFSNHTIIKVEAWTKDLFETIDLLIVPPNLSGNPYGFTDQEVEMVEEFVDTGGGVVFDMQGAAWDIADDLDDVTQQFGLTFDTDPLGYKEGTGGMCTSVTRSSLTTLFVGEIPPETVIKEHRDDVFVWARIAEESDVWINRTESERDVREPGDEDASGYPVGVAVAHGDGLVIGSGYNSVFDAEYRDSQWLLLANIIDVIGENAQFADRQVEHGEPSDDEAPSDDESEDDAQSENSIPGFGVGGALAGLGGVGYLLKRRFTDDETGPE